MFELTLSQFGIEKIPQILLSGNCQQLLSLTAIPAPAIRSAICRVPQGMVASQVFHYLSISASHSRKKNIYICAICYCIIFHLPLSHLFYIFSGQFLAQLNANVDFGSIPWLIYTSRKGINKHAVKGKRIS